MTYASLERARGTRTDAELARLVDELAAFPAWLRAAVEGASEAWLRARPALEPDGFSPLEQAWHLCDIEVQGYGPRLAALLAAEHPFLPDQDGARLAREGRYQERALGPALEAFERARRENVVRLRGLARESFARTGELEGVGCLSLAELLGRWVEHDRAHEGELAALLGVRERGERR